MKKIISILFCLTPMLLLAQTAVQSTIKQVKVYKQQAEITRSALPKVAAGTQTIVLTGISTSINPSSLQVEFNNPSSTLLSAKYEKNYLLPKVNNPKIEELHDQLEELDDEFSWIKDQQAILKGMEDILNKNKDLGGTEKGFTAAQVVELSNSYKIKFLEIRKELKTLVKQEKGIAEEKTQINNQLSEMNALLNKPSGNIVLQIDSRSATTLTIQCSYLVSNAGWSPLYDLRSDGIVNNVKLNHKANIHQNTGIDWEDVDMVVSTGNPAINNNRPILRPLYANLFQPVYAQAESRAKDAPMANLAYKSSGDMADGYAYNTEITENQLSIEYRIMNKQSILSDRKENMVALTSYDLNTDYIYHTVPKLSNGAFLLAKISDWSKHNLVAGKANIFFDGAFVGNTQINPQVTSDTLLISMGRDNNITVERTPIQDYTKTKFIGTNKKETFGYEIAVRNKKGVAIEIEILDQIPVSQNSQIDVTLEEKGSAEYLKEYGKLMWKLSISPGQTKKERFVYTVKYPKKERVRGIK